MNLILFVFACVGFTSIMVESAMMEPLRNFLKKRIYTKAYVVFECFQCMGFWTGLACGLALISNVWYIVLMCGFAGSFVSSFAAYIMNYLSAKTIIDLGDDE